MKKLTHIIMLSLTLIISGSCARKVREAKYSMYEVIGLEKRDLFKSELRGMKEQQEDAGEAYKDALTTLKEIYQVDLGDLEGKYSRLKDDYDDAKDESEDLKKRIDKVNTVASDLFREWEGEIKSMSDKNLRSKSSAQLKKTKENYKTLQKKMKEAESQLDPILTKFNDQVLFLKHNLNSKAIAGLKSESQKIQDDIESLIKDVEASSKETQALIKSL